MKEGDIYAIIAALGTALIILINKMGLSVVPPLMFGTWRSLVVAGGLLLVNSLLRKNKKVSVKKSDINYLVISGVLGTLAVITIFYGQELTTAINTGFLLRLSPLFVILMAPFMVGENLTKKHLGSLALMLVGAYLILTEGQLVFLIGDLLIIATALTNALSDLLARKALFRVPTVTAAYLKNVVMMILLFVILAINGFVIPNIEQLFWIILSGSVLIGFWITFFKAMKTIGANNTSLYSYLSPVFVVIGAFFLLGETLTMIKLIGGAAILIGAYLIPKN
jgi:drug/metabolite transporter (DMT)-like permease